MFNMAVLAGWGIGLGDFIVMPTVVVIEDDLSIRKFIGVNLRARGYTVLEAEDAEQGLSLLRANQPCLVLLDNRMPGMSGVELAQQIGADQSLAEIPVVLLTGAAPETLGDLSTVPIIAGVLLKPISVDELLSVVTAYT
jgi:chemosensory pili system protein ChpA (sensor histidine kinase/response regulator)